MELPLNIWKCAFRTLRQINKSGIRFYSEKIVPLDESTVIGRIVLYMNNEYIKPNANCKTKEELKDASKYSINSVIDKLKLDRANHISNLKSEDIEDLLHTFKYDNYMSNKHHFRRLMQIIDAECCSRLDDLDSTSVLRILNQFTQILPNKIREYQFYNRAIDRLMSEVEFLSREELLQTMFYIALEKRTKNAQVRMRTCLRHFAKEDIRGLSVEELCIICNSTFKTSTKISNLQILEIVKETVHNKLYLLKDTALFVTLIKTLRHNRYQDEDLLNTISYTIFFNKTYTYYPFPVLCHILAMYADSLYYNEELLKLFVDLGLKQIQEVKIDLEVGNIRVKDITRFLWILSTLAYKNVNNEMFVDVIVPNILERIKAGQYKREIEELINSILYMWMLNYQATELIPYALTEENIVNVRDIKSRTKQRLNLLLTCIFFENRKLFRQLNIKANRSQNFNTDHQLDQRPNFRKVLNALRQLTRDEPEMPVNKFEVSYEVPYLEICGIVGYTKKVYKTVYIEVLDDYVSLKNRNNVPSGPMQLKLRILREMDNALITVSMMIIYGVT
ncbi:fast leu-rich domain-containing [Holotrichia oblita]|uniref:Fast leu-rich domain-containing n=1 Tax=Holotrichia oblita TaxID=644536 RepID=A0ACB9TJV7_HOLOL|nr:fast leu-rich domain-containing [Holotrichia oblita]